VGASFDCFGSRRLHVAAPSRGDFVADFEDFNGVPQLEPGSWLHKAFEYVRVRSMLPDAAIFWTIAAYCGAALQDKLCVDWAVKPIYPNLPLLIVMPSGRGKTGAANAAEPLFDRCLPYKIAEDATAESVTTDLAMYGRGVGGNTIGIWVIPELADIFGQKDYQQGSVARLTRLFDNPLNREISRRTSGRVMMQGRCVLSWIAGTTFEWLQRHVDEAVSAGGFLPRLLVIHSKEMSKFVADPQRDETLIRDLNTELFGILSQVPTTRVPLLPEQWLPIAESAHNDKIVAADTPRETFIARRPENILRISMILGVFGKAQKVRSLFSTSSVTLGNAEKCCKWFEDQAVKLSSDLKVRLFGRIVNSVAEHTERRGTVSYFDLCHDYNILSYDLRLALRELVDQGRVKWNGMTGKAGVVEHIIQRPK